jgi:hypothetical protein
MLIDINTIITIIYYNYNLLYRMSIYSIGGSISNSGVVQVQLLLPKYTFKGSYVEPGSWTGFESSIIDSLNESQKREFMGIFRKSIYDYDQDSIKNLTDEKFIKFVKDNCPQDAYDIVEIPEYILHKDYCIIHKDRDVYSNITKIFLNFDAFVVKQISLIMDNSEDVSLISKLLSECRSEKERLKDKLGCSVTYNVSDIVEEGMILNF